MMRSNATALLLVVTGLTAGGCGVGGILIGSAIGGGGGGSSPAKPPPPTVHVIVPEGSSASNYVELSYVLRDPQVRANADRPGGDADPRVRVFPQFRFPTTLTWFDMTETRVAASEGTRGLALGQHSFVWNTVVDLGGIEGDVVVRVLAEYEDAEGIRRGFRSREAQFAIDNRFTTTVFGEDAGPPSDVDTFPVDMRPEGDAFLVADFGANIVERVDTLGQAERLAGYGVPGDASGVARNPGVARLPVLISLERDAGGSLYTNHGDRLLVTNRMAADLVFGLADGDDDDADPDSVVIAPRTIATVRIPALRDARGLRLHPSGAFVLANRIESGDYEIRAVNPQDPASPASSSITLGTVVVAPGASARLAGGGVTFADDADGSASRIEDASSVAIGPDGETYFAERALGRVRVLNTTSAAVTVSGHTVAPGAVFTVAGGNGTGRAGDGGVARDAQFNSVSSIDVSPARLLFVADTGNARVRVVNLGDLPQVFAETEVGPGEVATAAGGGIGGVGSKARALELHSPGAVALDATGSLLVADEGTVILVNGGLASVVAYGKTTSPARTAKVYDAERRSGPPLSGPRAAHLRTPNARDLLLTDRTTVRILNLSRDPVVFGGASAEPGGVAIVAGGAVPGFSGDGGPARSAAFDTPSALASGRFGSLFVADTGNDRIRYVNLGDPVTGLPEAQFGVTVLPGNVDTIVGGAAGPLPDDGDGLQPLSCALSAPSGIAYSPADLLYIADTGHHRIRVVNPGATDVAVAGVPVAANSITTLIGSGAPGFTADGGGPWTIDTPTAVAVDRDLVYFAESGNSMIRVLNISAQPVRLAGVVVPPREIRTIVGTGIRGNGGDGGPGSSAQIDAPVGFFLLTAGGVRTALFFADAPQHVVRMVNLTDADLAAALDEDGRVSTTVPGAAIVTIAGGPNTPGTPNFPSFDGDGEEAAAMRLSSPWGVAVTAKESCLAHLMVMDQGNARIRRAGAPPVRSCFVGP